MSAYQDSGGPFVRASVTVQGGEVGSKLAKSRLGNMSAKRQWERAMRWAYKEGDI